MEKFKKVFVIDDDKIYHFILKNLLSKKGIAVTPHFCENGLEALEVLKDSIEKNAVPDIILLDINMPVMDGWQFLEEYRKLKASYNLQTPIYMITSSNDQMDFERAKDYQTEIVEYVLKPLDENDLYRLFLN